MDFLGTVRDKTKSLNTHGIVQLDQMKKLLILAVEHPDPDYPFPKIEELDAQVKKSLQQQRAALDKELEQYFQRIAASFPNEVKVGMTFKKVGSNVVYEIKKVYPKSANTNLKGDDAFWFDAQEYVGDKARAGLDKVQLSGLKKMKFLKTD